MKITILNIFKHQSGFMVDKSDFESKPIKNIRIYDLVFWNGDKYHALNGTSNEFYVVPFWWIVKNQIENPNEIGSKLFLKYEKENKELN